MAVHLKGSTSVHHEHKSNVNPTLNNVMITIIEMHRDCFQNDKADQICFSSRGKTNTFFPISPNEDFTFQLFRDY